jgi:hypothetical protein
MVIETQGSGSLVCGGWRPTQAAVVAVVAVSVVAPALLVLVLVLVVTLQLLPLRPRRLTLSARS